MLQIKSLNFGFHKKPLLFKNLMLDIEPNKIYGLFGLNGAGKTTLLNLMAGLLFPDSGDCTYKGNPMSERLPSTLNDLFILPEQFDLPKVKGREFLNQYSPFYTGFSRDEFDRIADLFNLSSDEKLTELSYGQRKKFLIAFAFASGVSLLLLDEPTNGLDIPSKSQFRKLMASVDLEDRSIVISTHQVRDLAQSIDHALILENGRIILNASIEALSEALDFVTIPESQTDFEKYIYREQVLGGYKAIIHKNNQPDAGEPIDLELLFNASIEHHEKLNAALMEVNV